MSHVLGDDGRPLRLEALDEQHLEALRRLRNLDEVRFGFRSSGLVEPSAQRAWFSRYLDRPDDLMWLLLDEGDHLLGAAALYDIDAESGTAEFGRLMVDPDRGRGRGLGLLLVRSLLDEAARLGLARVRLVVKADNNAALTVYRRAGFRVGDGPCEPDEIEMVVEITRP